MSNQTPERVSARPAGPLHHWFLAHPNDVGESYLQHQRAAFRIAFALAGAGAAAALHALVPALCKSTARRRITELHDHLQARSNLPSHVGSGDESFKAD